MGEIPKTAPATVTSAWIESSYAFISHCVYMGRQMFMDGVWRPTFWRCPLGLVEYRGEAISD